MKITDMNLICLEECFEYLEFRDLLSVADANIRLRRAAQFVYLRKYSEQIVNFQLQWRDYIRSLKFVSRGSVLIEDLSTSFQLLRCFGQLIKYVNVHCYFNYFRPVLTQINEYCAESLVKISFYSAKQDHLTLLTKQFTKIQEVEMFNCYLTENGWFKKTFPKIEQLNIKNNSEMDITCLVHHYSYLEKFSFDTTINHLPGSIKENITAILELNPQLKELNLRMNEVDNVHLFDIDNFWKLIETNQILEDLTLSGNFVNISNITENKIHLKSIKKFSIYGDNRLKFPFLFDQLEFIHVNHLTMEFFEFIDQHPNIRKLSVGSTYNQYSNINLSHLMKAVPLLTDITISYYKLATVEDVFRLVFRFRLLKTLTLLNSFYDLNTWHNELRTRLEKEWKISGDSCNIYLNRIDTKNGSK